MTDTQIEFPAWAYVVAEAEPPGRRIGIVTNDFSQPGRTILEGADVSSLSIEQLREHVDALNRSRGIPPFLGRAMIAGAMFGEAAARAIIAEHTAETKRQSVASTAKRAARDAAASP